MKKKGIVVIALVVCVLAAIAAMFGYRMMQQKQQVRDLLELGNQYLEDEQYEEAIVAYKQLLAIEPKEETARENIVVAAVEWSDDLIEMHEYDKAEEVVAAVYSIVPDERLENKRQEIIDKRDVYEKEQMEIKKKEEARKQALEQITADLSELAQICMSGDDGAVFAYVSSDAFQALLQSEYIEFDKKYETEYGTLGLCNEGKFLYFGDYDGEIRAGNGIWYSISSAENSQYVARGEWRNDKPNGNQLGKWKDNNMSNHEMEGNVIDGLWDGQVIDRFDDEQGRVWDWTVIFHMGHVEVLDTNEKGAVVSQVFGRDGRILRTLVYADADQQNGIWGFN